MALFPFPPKIEDCKGRHNNITVDISLVSKSVVYAA